MGFLSFELGLWFWICFESCDLLRGGRKRKESFGCGEPETVGCVEKPAIFRKSNAQYSNSSRTADLNGPTCQP